MIIIDGAERGRPGRTMVDYYDADGERRVKTFRSREEAEQFAKRQQEFLADAKIGAIDPDITLQDFFPTCLIIWREEQQLEQSTIDGYTTHAQDHILPILGKIPIRALTRQHVLNLKSRLSEKHASGCSKRPLKRSRRLSKGTIKSIIGSTLSSMLGFAVDEGIRADNPASRMGRRKGKRASAEELVQPIAVSKALTKRERDLVLMTARRMINEVLFLFLYLLVATGMRPGEARALRWRYFDLDGTLENHNGVPMVLVEVTFKEGERLGVTKNKKTRWVELERSLCDRLRRRKARLNPHPEDFVFCGSNSREALGNHELQQPWPFILATAGITRWLPVYCLRHTYASILLSEAVHTAFITAQLGHASTAITEKYYANWLKIKSFGALSRLGLEDSGVAEPVAAWPPGAEGSHATH